MRCVRGPRVREFASAPVYAVDPRDMDEVVYVGGAGALHGLETRPSFLWPAGRQEESH